MVLSVGICCDMLLIHDVAESAHTQNGTDAAAQQSGEEEVLLGGAALTLFFGLALVDTHHEKGDEVDNKQIADQPKPGGTDHGPEETVLSFRQK